MSRHIDHCVFDDFSFYILDYTSDKNGTWLYAEVAPSWYYPLPSPFVHKTTGCSKFTPDSTRTRFIVPRVWIYCIHCGRLLSPTFTYSRRAFGPLMDNALPLTTRNIPSSKIKRKLVIFKLIENKICWIQEICVTCKTNCILYS